ncbi:MAG TPA: hypothetical protein VGB99_17170 [Acidobacteriota bacterium]
MLPVRAGAQDFGAAPDIYPVVSHARNPPDAQCRHQVVRLGAVADSCVVNTNPGANFGLLHEL